MKIEFDQEEIKALHDLNLSFDPEKDLTDDEYFAMDDSVESAIMDHLDVNYNPSPKGRTYEAIMDKLAAAE